MRLSVLDAPLIQAKEIIDADLCLQLNRCVSKACRLIRAAMLPSTKRLKGRTTHV